MSEVKGRKNLGELKKTEHYLLGYRNSQQSPRQKDCHSTACFVIEISGAGSKLTYVIFRQILTYLDNCDSLCENQVQGYGP